MNQADFCYGTLFDQWYTVTRKIAALLRFYPQDGGM